MAAAHSASPRKRRSPVPAAGLSFSLLTWNVLAHVHTHFNDKVHKAAAAAGSPKLESEAQCHARYLRTVHRLREAAADIVLLQEVDSNFIPENWSDEKKLPCGETLIGYNVFQSRLNEKTAASEGTAVLVSKTHFAPIASAPKVSIKDSKTATVVFAQHVSGHRVGVASVHLRFGDPRQNLEMLQQVVHALNHGDNGVESRAVIAGDFNVEASAAAFVTLDQFLRASGFTRQPFAHGQTTALASDHSYVAGKAIDFVYARGLRSTAKFLECGRLPADGGGPWGEAAAGLDGSDHAWVKTTFTPV